MASAPWDTRHHPWDSQAHPLMVGLQSPRGHLLLTESLLSPGQALGTRGTPVAVLGPGS